jgi:uncharacterized protein DUF6933
VLIIHAVQKLLNTSRLEASLYVSQPDPGQYLHSWYARLLATCFRGKMMVMYLHEPSLTVILCKGKAIQGTWKPFIDRLRQLLFRFQFPVAFITTELAFAKDYTVSRTNSKSMLSFMNQIVFELEYECGPFENFDDIEWDAIENRMMDRLHQVGKVGGDYLTPLKYWRQEIGLTSKFSY